MIPSNARDSTVRLRDGRALAVCEWGVSDGPVVLAFHGSPASRVWWPGEARTRAAGVRLITVDRPGYGGSDPLPGRRIADWAADVAELTALLDISRFGVVGWSGGAPYATAVAALLPDRLTGVCVVSSDSITCVLPDVELDDDDRHIRDLVEQYGLAEAARRYAQEEAGWAEGLRTDPRTFFGIDDAAEGDRWVFEDAAVTDEFFAGVREAVAQGAIGAASDWTALHGPWGFSLEEIEVDVHFWHGAQDWVELGAFERVVGLVPRSTLTVWPDVGHMGIVRYWDSVLATALGEDRRCKA